MSKITELTSAVERAAKLLIDKKFSIAFAESATAGSASAEFSLACHAGKFLRGGLVCYDAELKCNVLDVSHEMLDKCTPESMEVTAAIAQGLAGLIPADIHVGITGLPCPGGSETIEKPVGTMFLYAIFQDKELFADRVFFQGGHKEIVEQTIQHVALLLIKHLS
ncbi:MAG: CinA family protein [Bacteroidota bacterium]